MSVRSRRGNKIEIKRITKAGEAFVIQPRTNGHWQEEVRFSQRSDKSKRRDNQKRSRQASKTCLIN